MKTKERGITLIALVVTIIVLLILAGVSIQMLTGQSGILSQAREAKKQTEIADAKESAQRELMEEFMINGGEDLDREKIHGILEKYFDEVPDLTNGAWDTFPEDFPKLKVKGTEYEVDIADIYNGSIGVAKAGTEVAVPKGMEWDTNKVIPTADGEGNVIPVPKEFYYVGGTKNTGFVISDVSGDNLDNIKEGNQFVWVPVPVAITTDTSIEGTTIDLSNENVITPMVESINGNYRGIIYDYSEITDMKKIIKVGLYPVDINIDGSWHEPDIVKGNNSNKGEFNDIDYGIKLEGEDGLQAEYNQMIQSVMKYKGFYVARYEMSLEDGRAQYKKGKKSEGGDTIPNQWYGFYQAQKEFAQEKVNVVSSMMWGSQYDAIMNWMVRTGTNISKTIEDNRNQTKKTGLGNNGMDNSMDISNNIYDLYGSRLEWTLEACSTRLRALRGGSAELNYPLYVRNWRFPTDESTWDGSRGIIYIKTNK